MGETETGTNVPVEERYKVERTAFDNR